MSTDSSRKFFEEFIDDYYVECEEHLASTRNLLLELEKGGRSSNRDTLLNDLLRDLHSIKGLSAMVGVEDVTQVAHHIEGYLRELKDPSVEINSAGLSHVLAGVGAIEQVLAARRSSAAPPDVSALLGVLAAAAEDVKPKARVAQKAPAAADAAAGEQRKWMVEFRPSAELAAKGITVSTIRDRLASLGEITNATPRVLENGGVAFEFTVISDAPDSRFEMSPAEGLFSRQTGIVSGNAEPSAVPAPAAPSAVASPANAIRVDMNRLDDLMRIVGELVITRFHLSETLRSEDECLTPAGLRNLQEISTSMEHQLRELRDTVIRTRMVPIGQIFDRMRFVVRGLERETQKQVQILISGQETELDKVIVEKMTDPLLHLVRNSVSHGIESAEERAAAGKPAEGVIRLSASTLGDSVLVEVEDDGRGLDIAKVTGRARALGMLEEDEELDSKRLLDVICAPGFTTRDAADLTSGRGVGMEAVQTAVSELGGIMTLSTEPGKGTRFKIQLPLTLTITDSLMVTVERQKFAVPQSGVREVFSVDSTAVTMFENNEVVPYRGGVLPILRLNRLFGIKSKAKKRIHVLVIGADSGAVGLGVDRILGQREIVVRGITDPMLKIPGIGGATETGDGKPVLILDVHALLRTQRDRYAMESQS